MSVNWEILNFKLPYLPLSPAHQLLTNHPILYYIRLGPGITFFCPKKMGMQNSGLVTTQKGGKTHLSQETGFFFSAKPHLATYLRFLHKIWFKHSVLSRFRVIGVLWQIYLMAVHWLKSVTRLVYLSIYLSIGRNIYFNEACLNWKL